MNPKRTFLFFALFTIALLGVVAAQEYDDSSNEIEEDDENELEGDSDEDDTSREARQVSGYAFQAPSGECIRAWREPEYCGGFRGGNGGTCDRHCLQRGFPLSWCREHYCLCHRGKDLGRECEVRG